MLDISALLEELKRSPYEEISVYAPHSGRISFSPALKEGLAVYGPQGEFKEKAGTLLAHIERERNLKEVSCPERGEIIAVRRDLHEQFVEAGTELVRLRHFLSRPEAEKRILQKSLHLFLAPERARYYFVPSKDIKLKTSGPRSVSVRNGEEVFIMSRMKRETPLPYSGPDGVIYAVYFSHAASVESSTPLIGVCSPDLLAQVEEVVLRVQTEWKERY
ncbi:MAG: biotin attachment protein [Desulfovibrio sp.]|jgi:biotin carboxyl carrier protein|nr:biotin attachment protein [Desulfovibrio sp.]